MQRVAAIIRFSKKVLHNYFYNINNRENGLKPIYGYMKKAMDFIYHLPLSIAFELSKKFKTKYKNGLAGL